MRNEKKMTENEKFAIFEVYILVLGNFCSVVKVVFKYLLWFEIKTKLTEVQTKYHYIDPLRNTVMDGT